MAVRALWDLGFFGYFAENRLPCSL
ncbi:hypothetical protein JMJ77_0000556, partial [Colletotrichum scovillei]